MVNNKTWSNLNRKALKSIIYINFVSATNICIILHKTLIYHTLYNHSFYTILIYFNKLVSLKGSHTMWMLFARHASYSKFCKDSLTLINWPKHKKKKKWNKICVYFCVRLKAETILLSFNFNFLFLYFTAASLELFQGSAHLIGIGFLGEVEKIVFLLSHNVPFFY
jgi:hypothetical protein